MFLHQGELVTRDPAERGVDGGPGERHDRDVPVVHQRASFVGGDDLDHVLLGVWLRREGARHGDQSLVVVIDRSARSVGLGSALTRNQPVGEDGIRVQLRDAPFDSMTRWLTQLQTANGLALDSASIERTDAPGAVNASLILRDPG